jgi:hypothetical protein
MKLRMDGLWIYFSLDIHIVMDLGRVLELASVMLTKLRRHFKCRVFIALYIASCSIINNQKSSAASPFYLI